MKTTNKVELTVLPADAMPGYEPVAVAARPKPKKAAKPKPTTRPKVYAVDTPAPLPAHAVKAWATFGVVFTLVMSAGLNGFSNAQHSPVAWAGWLMGLAVPVLVLVLSKVCGEKHRAGQRAVAWFAGGAGVSLLFLSVWHCANSIALLTGSGLVLAVPLAVAIDAGLVACEIALISEPRD